MKPDTKLSYQERMLRVLVHIQANLDRPLPLDELASVAAFSPFHFHRVFRGMVGEGVAEHLRRLRLERAAYQLLTTEFPVTRVALEAGYQTHESFSRAFKEMFGKSPSDHRARQRRIWVEGGPGRVAYRPDGQAVELTPLDTGGTAMEVSIKKLEPMRVAFVRHQGPYEACGQAWGRLYAWAGPRGLLGPHTVMVGLSYDDPEVTPGDKVRYDACITVGPEVGPAGEVGVQEIPGGDYAVTLHQGPYDGLKQTYAQLCGQWMPESHREIRSLPSCEVYLNDPDTIAPQDLLVEIRLPLQD